MRVQSRCDLWVFSPEFVFSTAFLGFYCFYLVFGFCVHSCQRRTESAHYFLFRIWTELLLFSPDIQRSFLSLGSHFTFYHFFLGVSRNLFCWVTLRCISFCCDGSICYLQDPHPFVCRHVFCCVRPLIFLPCFDFSGGFQMLHHFSSAVRYSSHAQILAE